MKKGFIEALRMEGFEVVTKGRRDVVLKYLYYGKQSRVGRDTSDGLTKGLGQQRLVAAFRESHSKSVIAFIQRLLDQHYAMVLQQVVTLVI